MKKSLIVSSIAVLAVIVGGLGAVKWLSRAPLRVPARPSNVPSTATWVGERWVSCVPTSNEANIYACEFFDDVNGHRLQIGNFQWVGTTKSPITSGQVLPAMQWDGNDLVLTDGKLMPAGPQTHLPDSPDRWTEPR
jgi:hypothetical protein